MTKVRKNPKRMKVIYRKYFIHWKSKKRVYRKNGGYFRFLVPEKS